MSGLTALPTFASLCAALAAGALHPAARFPGRVNAVGRSGEEPGLTAVRRRWARRGPVVLVAGGVLLGLFVVGPLTALSAAVVGAGVLVVLRRRARLRIVTRRGAAWQSALARCAAELQAGAELSTALRAGAGGVQRGRRSPEPGDPATRLAAAAAAAQAGGEPWLWLGEVDDPTSRALAACLALAARLGAAPAPLIVRLAAVEAAQELQRRETRVALATATSTGRLLAFLPLAGVGLAAAMGASAPRFLLGSVFGQLCLLVAAVLETTGLLWLERLLPGDRR